jgi:hypothetical protein
MAAVLTMLAMVVTPCALFFAWLWADEQLADRADRRRRAEQDRQVDAEWFAEMAAIEPTPVYDQLKCEEIARAEGWTQ